ncbi:50S ribosomal protein L29 [Thermofilum pendens]|nr:50S ribosomal protein L29 [Thermofilum pendens]
MAKQAEELRKMSREERQKRLQELRGELARLKAQAHRGSLENVASIRKIKREIARILTIENELRRKAPSAEQPPVQGSASQQ